MSNHGTNLRNKHVSIAGTTPLANCTAASRLTMMASLQSQAVTLHKPERKVMTSGVDKELLSTIDDIATPDVKIRIVKIIPIYKRVKTRGKIKRPLLIIYQELDAEGRFSFIKIPTYRSRSSLAGGFSYVPTKDFKRLKEGATFNPNTRLVTSTGEQGDEYSAGINANFLHCSSPEVTEDGLMVNEEFIKGLKYDSFFTIERVIDNSSTLTNMYGDDESYKPLPQVGSRVRPDNIIFTVRKHTEAIAPYSLELDKDNINNYIFDQKITLPTGSEAYIEEVVVTTDRRVKFEYDSTKPINDLHTLSNERIDHHNEVLAMYSGLKAQHGNNDVPMTPALAALIKDSFIYAEEGYKNSMITGFTGVKVGGKISNSIRRRYKLDPLPNLIVKIVIRVVKTPDIASKLTTLYASKGVIVSIKPASEMPKTKDGVVADICLDTRAIDNRMIIGLLYDQYFTQIATTLTSKLRSAVLSKVSADMPLEERIASIDNLLDTDSNLLNKSIASLSNAYKIACPGLAEEHIPNAVKKDLIELVRDSVVHGVSLPMPLDSLSKDSIYNRYKRAEKSNVAPDMHHVMFYDYRLKKYVESKNKMRIYPVYFLVLCRTGDEMSAFNSASINSFGVSVIKTPKTKILSPINSNNVKAINVMEASITSGVIDIQACAELHDRCQSPATIAAEARSILTVDKPGGINRTVDRNIVPYGKAAHSLFDHIIGASGLSLELDTD